MSSTIQQIDCPYCGFLGGESYYDSDGEERKSCSVCGYSEDFSDLDMEYFNSEEEMVDYQEELESENHTPTKEELKNVSDLVKFANFLYIKGHAIHDILEFDIFLDNKANSIRSGKPFDKVFNSYLKTNGFDKKAIRLLFGG